MLDIILFRAEKGGNPELLRESQRRRYANVNLIDEIIEIDKIWREKAFISENCSKEISKISKEIGTLMKAKKTEGVDELKVKIAEIQNRQAALKTEADELLKQRDFKLTLIGNIVHESVPVSNNEENNIVNVTWGNPRTDRNELWHHHRLLYMIDGYEPERGSIVAGHRGYYLKGAGMLLNMALINYGTHFLSKRGYTPVQPPFFMRKNVMSECAQLSQFDEELYKVTGAAEDFYLIATSEQPIAALHRDETLEPKSLPIRYAGSSACFRKEAGAHGKDTWGIFRVHQFDKIEQFCITSPEESWDEHEKMLKLSEEFYQSLGIPYRVVTIVSGELNNAAAKKYDLEGWFPCFAEYRELVSCSNCTDYQSRRLKIRMGATAGRKQGERPFVHMLNSTLCATTRTICAILENHQCAEGIRVPEPLRALMGGIELIPFKNAPKKDWKKTDFIPNKIDLPTPATTTTTTPATTSATTTSATTTTPETTSATTATPAATETTTASTTTQ
eukprot:TRINITY_DN225_c0_g1_i1.p1 TRINITY_DN225_c0_g1~~TRINITY_DN225_c0_g1_i1.p1  ORF type:complete len:504 (-),score=269.13 TRINITY_DN225_c0_g1_i1:92-1603(-)